MYNQNNKLPKKRKRTEEADDPNYNPYDGFEPASDYKINPDDLKSTKELKKYRKTRKILTKTRRKNKKKTKQTTQQTQQRKKRKIAFFETTQYLLRVYWDNFLRKLSQIIDYDQEIVISLEKDFVNGSFLPNLREFEISKNLTEKQIVEIQLIWLREIPQWVLESKKSERQENFLNEKEVFILP
jgi:hypothetical protein